MEDNQKQLVLDYKMTFDSEHGRRVLNDLQKWSGFNDRIIPAGVPDVTAFDLGRRDMFLYIKDKIDADLDKEVQETAETAESEVEDASGE